MLGITGGPLDLDSDFQLISKLEGILKLVKGILKEKPEIRAILLDPWELKTMGRWFERAVTKYSNLKLGGDGLCSCRYLRIRSMQHPGNSSIVSLKRRQCQSPGVSSYSQKKKEQIVYSYLYGVSSYSHHIPGDCVTSYHPS